MHFKGMYYFHIPNHQNINRTKKIACSHPTFQPNPCDGLTFEDSLDYWQSIDYETGELEIFSIYDKHSIY